MALIYTRTITDDEMRCLENDLLDVKEWIDGAIIGKISKCKKRIAQSIINENPDNITRYGANPVQGFLASTGYKNRRERDEAARTDAALQA